MWNPLKQTSISSEKNGKIVVLSTFGRVEVFVNGFYQSSRYIRIMWRKAFRRVPADAVVDRILMLGLGGGSAIGELRNRFPGCEITAVEWDPAMIALYHELNPSALPITVLEGDAAVIVPNLTETFDLVVVDLFKGNETPTELASSEMIAAIARVLVPGGFCLLNAFISVHLLLEFDTHFSREASWKFRFNTLALYRITR